MMVSKVLLLGLALTIVFGLSYVYYQEATRVRACPEFNQGDSLKNLDLADVLTNWGKECPVDPAETEKDCVKKGGTYLAEFNECEGLKRAGCEELGGSFDECGSACRHDANPNVCILVCVPVCEL